MYFFTARSCRLQQQLQSLDGNSFVQLSLMSEASFMIYAHYQVVMFSHRVAVIFATYVRVDVSSSFWRRCTQLRCSCNLHPARSSRALCCSYITLVLVSAMLVAIMHLRPFIQKQQQRLVFLFPARVAFLLLTHPFDGLRRRFLFVRSFLF